MSKADLELDEPPKRAGNADDLLAELAGEQIDRLLQEAGEEKEADAPAGSLPESEGRNDRPEKPQAVEADETASRTPDAAEVDSRLEKQLDDLFEQIQPNERAPSQVEPRAVSQDEAGSDEVRAAGEKEALLGHGEEAENAHEAEGQGERGGTGGVPLWVKPLEWVNAPLAGASQGVRDWVAKVAIITFLNALALMLYVLIFR